jgi:hypothetical protein
MNKLFWLKGRYLFPLLMTGEIPRRVKELVLNPGQALQGIVLVPQNKIMMTKIGWWARDLS